MDDLTSLLESVSISKSQRDKPQLLIGGYKFRVDAKPDGDGGYKSNGDGVYRRRII